MKIVKNKRLSKLVYIRVKYYPKAKRPFGTAKLMGSACPSPTPRSLGNAAYAWLLNSYRFLQRSRDSLCVCGMQSNFQHGENAGGSGDRPAPPDTRWVSRFVEWGLQGILRCRCWGVVVKVRLCLLRWLCVKDCLLVYLT